ncbi:unnamed protein product [Prunus armeniaca]
MEIILMCEDKQVGTNAGAWREITQAQWAKVAAADKAFVDPNKWTQVSILSTTGLRRFSNDKTIRDYAEKTWGIEPCIFPSDG